MMGCFLLPPQKNEPIVESITFVGMRLHVKCCNRFVVDYIPAINDNSLPFAN
jgi:hypothetical protein